MQLHLLIADDEPSVLGLLQMLFVQQGYRVTTARDGQDVVEQAMAAPPDVMLLDIQMPRVSGVEAVKQLRADERFRTVPIIAMTAHVRDYSQPVLDKAGFNHLLTKPFDIPDLLEIVRVAVASTRDPL